MSRPGCKPASIKVAGLAELGAFKNGCAGYASASDSSTGGGMSKTSTDRLDYVFGTDLPEDPEQVDQLVEGLIGRIGLSILYGDSGSGKTFFAVGLGNAVAQGATFMGRRTVKGLVIYLATEAPARSSGGSKRTRSIQPWRRP